MGRPFRGPRSEQNTTSDLWGAGSQPPEARTWGAPERVSPSRVEGVATSSSADRRIGGRPAEAGGSETRPPST
eukprot:7389576-Pyramimonas_sp.AAC.1